MIPEAPDEISWKFNKEWATIDEDLHLAGLLTMMKIPTVLKSMAKSQKLEAARQDNLHQHLRAAS